MLNIFVLRRKASTITQWFIKGFSNRIIIHLPDNVQVTLMLQKLLLLIKAWKHKTSGCPIVSGTRILP